MYFRKLIFVTEVNLTRIRYFSNIIINITVLTEICVFYYYGHFIRT